MGTENTIHLTFGGLAARRIEHVAKVLVKPGFLCELVIDGADEKLQPHTTAKGFSERIFAVEDALQGGIITDSYAILDTVSADIVPGGDEIHAWLAAGTNYALGDVLVSDGAGALQALTSADLQAIAVVVEPTDLSASGAVDTMAKVRVI